LRRRKALWKLPELWKNQKTVFPTAPWTFGPQFPQRRLLLVLFLKHNFPSTPVGPASKPRASRPNEKWSMDFVSDCVSTGRVIRMLTVVDDCTRECPAIEVDTSLGGLRVRRVLDRIASERGLPEAIVLDNGPEFRGRALAAWSEERGVRLEFIQPGKPVQNAYAESFNGRLRDECLNANWFTSLKDARRKIESWRQDYNQQRPHSSLNYLPPVEFARTLVEMRA
jgi:putative transposase